MISTCTPKSRKFLKGLTTKCRYPFSLRLAYLYDLFFLLYGEGSLLAKLDTLGASITDVAFSCLMGLGVKKNGVKLAGVHTLAAAAAFCPIQRDDAGFLL
jgi:hypothetical protein